MQSHRNEVCARIFGHDTCAQLASSEVGAATKQKSLWNERVAEVYLIWHGCQVTMQYTSRRSLVRRLEYQWQAPPSNLLFAVCHTVLLNCLIQKIQIANGKKEGYIDRVPLKLTASRSVTQPEANSWTLEV
jgi:hypothetical protein